MCILLILIFSVVQAYFSKEECVLVNSKLVKFRFVLIIFPLYLSENEGSYVTAALGNTWSHSVNTRLILQYVDERKREVSNNFAMNLIRYPMTASENVARPPCHEPHQIPYDGFRQPDQTPMP